MQQHITTYDSLCGTSEVAVLTRVFSKPYLLVIRNSVSKSLRNLAPDKAYKKKLIP